MHVYVIESACSKSLASSFRLFPYKNKDTVKKWKCQKIWKTPFLAQFAHFWAKQNFSKNFLKVLLWLLLFFNFEYHCAPEVPLQNSKNMPEIMLFFQKQHAKTCHVYSNTCLIILFLCISVNIGHKQLTGQMMSKKRCASFI